MKRIILAAAAVFALSSLLLLVFWQHSPEPIGVWSWSENAGLSCAGCPKGCSDCGERSLHCLPV